MKKKLSILVLGLLLIGVNVLAADGDLIVEGNVGIGTTTPGQRLTVNGNIELPRTNFAGLYFGDYSSDVKGFVWRNAYGNPAVLSDTLIIGRDDYISEIFFDSFSDAAWAFCVGVSGVGYYVNCAEYGDSGLMDSNDYYFVWKHQYDSRYPESADIKFLFDGESNDGVMGFMEDEDYFFYDDDVVFNGNIGIGIVSPAEKVEVNGAIKIADTGSDCDASKEGTIKYVSSHFYGCDGQTWKQLD